VKGQTVRSVVTPMAYQMNRLLAALIGGPPLFLRLCRAGLCGGGVSDGSRTMR